MVFTLFTCLPKGLDKRIYRIYNTSLRERFFFIEGSIKGCAFQIHVNHIFSGNYLELVPSCYKI